MSDDRVRQRSRVRYLTPEEAAKYRTIREQIELEKPEINAHIRSHMAQQAALARVLQELRQVREGLGLSLAQIADRTGIDRSALREMEEGQGANFTVETITRYAEAVGKRVVVSLVDAA